MSLNVFGNPSFIGPREESEESGYYDRSVDLSGLDRLFKARGAWGSVWNQQQLQLIVAPQYHKNELLDKSCLPSALLSLTMSNVI